MSFFHDTAPSEGASFTTLISPLHFLGAFTIWPPAGFSQWETLVGKWEAGGRETPGDFFTLPTSAEPQAVAISLLVSGSAPLLPVCFKYSLLWL